MWLLLGTLALASDWEFRAQVGAELGRATFGVVDLGWRRGPLSIEWLTDTLHVQYGPSWARGRAWIAARAEAGAAGMFLSRWEDGRRAPERDLFAFYEGVEGGGLVYLPAGFYVGAQLRARYWHFLAFDDRDRPGARPVLRGDLLLGVHTELVRGWIEAGADWSLGWQPHVQGQLVTDLPGVVRPVLELRAGWGQGKDEITRVRLGGQNPYVVPLAGAAWAEFFVEDYVATRVGVEGGPATWTVGLVSDLVWFDGREELGFAARGAVHGRGRWIEASLGWAPWLPRPGSVAMTGWIRAGVDWGTGLAPRE